MLIMSSGDKKCRCECLDSAETRVIAAIAYGLLADLFLKLIGGGSRAIYRGCALPAQVR